MKTIILLTEANNLNFFKDILPSLISGLAVIVAVVIPYLLLRFEKVLTRNRDHTRFMGKMELFVLEWLIVTSENQQMVEEFLEVLQTPKGIFLKNFQYYEVPPVDFFTSYNSELVNKCFIQIRRLKTLNHHIGVISSEYLFYRRLLVEKETIKVENVKEFYIETLTSIEEVYQDVIKDLIELRVIIRLLLKRANKVQGLTMKNFFTFNQEKLLWHKKDTKFSPEEMREERIILENEMEANRKKE